VGFLVAGDRAIAHGGNPQRLVHARYPSWYSCAQPRYLARYSRPLRKKNVHSTDNSYLQCSSSSLHNRGLHGQKEMPAPKKRCKKNTGISWKFGRPYIDRIAVTSAEK
jgi:hypothetical protein